MFLQSLIFKLSSVISYNSETFASESLEKIENVLSKYCMLSSFIKKIVFCPSGRRWFLPCSCWIESQTLTDTHVKIGEGLDHIKRQRLERKMENIEVELLLVLTTLAPWKEFIN